MPGGARHGVGCTFYEYNPMRAGYRGDGVQHELVYDGLHVEHLTWQLPYGPPTEAVFLKPAGALGRLPAVLGLHDHGGNKYFGLAEDNAQLSNDAVHPMMKEHQRRLLRQGVSMGQ